MILPPSMLGMLGGDGGAIQVPPSQTAPAGYGPQTQPGANGSATSPTPDARKDFASAVLGDTVDEDEKARRLERLIALQEAVSHEINQTLVGREVTVLVEGPARRTPDWMSGRTPQMKTAVFPGPAAAGYVVRVRVTDATSHTLRGHAVG